MTDNAQRQTAVVIPFPTDRRPIRGTAQPVGRRVAAQAPTAVVECGSGWYHDAAINDVGTARH